jgi:hypothetical protein
VLDCVAVNSNSFRSTLQLHLIGLYVKTNLNEFRLFACTITALSMNLCVTKWCVHVRLKALWDWVRVVMKGSIISTINAVSSVNRLNLRSRDHWRQSLCLVNIRGFPRTVWVGVVSGLRAGQRGNRRFFFLLQNVRPAVGPISSPIKLIPKALFLREKLPRLEVHHSPPSGTVVKHVCSHSSPPPYTRIHDVYAGNSPYCEAKDVRYFLNLFSYRRFPHCNL